MSTLRTAGASRLWGDPSYVPRVLLVAVCVCVPKRQDCNRPPQRGQTPGLSSAAQCLQQEV